MILIDLQIVTIKHDILLRKLSIIVSFTFDCNAKSFAIASIAFFLFFFVLAVAFGRTAKRFFRNVLSCVIHIKAFPGAKSTQLNHYVTPTLEEYRYDAGIIHVGINDILRSKHDELDKLPENIIKVGNTCQKYNIGKIYISAILPSTRTNINTLDINKKLRDLCMKHNFEFIDHEQITSKFLWNDGIHLLDSGKSILGQNFVNRVSNFFRKNDSFLTDPHFQETIR